MKYFATLICLFLLVANALAQVNLVPNGNFEEHDGCPNGPADFQLCEDWDNLYGSPDYYHLCGTGSGGVPSNHVGNQHPFSDSAYIGVASYTTFFSGGQEIAQSQLIQPLTAGTKYRVKFRASYPDHLNFSVCCIGAVLSAGPPPQGPYIQNWSSVEMVIPEVEFDTLGWFQLDQIYTAIGGETHIYLGTFRPEAQLNPVAVFPGGDPNYNSAGFYIDDVEVYEDDLVGTEEEKLQFKLISELVTEQLEITIDKPVQLNMLDISGRMVLSEQLNSGHSSVNVSSIPNGMYVAVFTSENGQTTSKKILKAN